MRYQALGPSMCYATACAAGNHAIGDAFRMIRLNEASVVLAGGAEAAISPWLLAGLETCEP